MEGWAHCHHCVQRKWRMSSALGEGTRQGLWPVTWNLWHHLAHRLMACTWGEPWICLGLRTAHGSLQPASCASRVSTVLAFQSQGIRKVPGLTLQAGSLGAFALHGTAGVMSQHAEVSAQRQSAWPPAAGSAARRAVLHFAGDWAIRYQVCSSLQGSQHVLCTQSPGVDLPPRNKRRCYAPHALPGALPHP